MLYEIFEYWTKITLLEKIKISFFTLERYIEQTNNIVIVSNGYNNFNNYFDKSLQYKIKNTN